MRLARSAPSLSAALGLCAGLAAGGPATTQQQLGAGYAGVAAAEPAMVGMHEAHQRMDRRMRQVVQGGGGTEHHFTAMMVPHHEGGVEMARAALPFPRHRAAPHGRDDDSEEPARRRGAARLAGAAPPNAAPCRLEPDRRPASGRHDS